MEEVAAHLAEQAWDTDWALRTLDQYDELVEMAKEVARVVFSMRWPRAYEPSFDIDFSEEYRDQPRMVTASYYARSDTDSFAFPLAYLHMGYDQIVTAEDIVRDEAAAAAAEKLRAAQEKTREMELATLRRLKERYPDA